MSHPYGSLPPQGGPNKRPNAKPHGGNLDPFALSFDAEIGASTPTTANDARPGASSMHSRTPSSPSTKSQFGHGISRVPVGAKSPKDKGPINFEEPLLKQAPSSYVTEERSGVGGPYNTTTGGPDIQVSRPHSSDADDVEMKAALHEEDPDYHVRRTPLKGHLRNVFSTSTSYQIRSPHSIQKPGYKNAGEPKFRHRDSLQRVYSGRQDERYLDPGTGRLRELVVQCTDRVYRGHRNSTYKRTFIRNVAPWTLRIANWPMQHIDEHSDLKTTKWDRFMLVVKWPISCYLLNNIVGIPGVASAGSVVNGGKYDPFPYRYWGFCKVTRNAVEEIQNTSPAGVTNLAGGGALCSDMPSNRLLEPTYLCFVGTEKYGRSRLVADWKKDTENLKYHGRCPEYLFISYTDEHFQIHDGNNNVNYEELQALHAIATKAARDAGLVSYWLAHSCMPKEILEAEVYRLSDIIRGAHSLAIAVGPGLRDSRRQNTAQSMLQHWGERLWTLPEVLLISSQNPVKVYIRGQEEPLDLAKNQFAALAWEDSPTSRQLIDHYEGNLILSRLELVSIAMQCLFARKTIEFAKGDHAYALMGLLLIRPMVDNTDSSFQAFARLSLANDSDKLLERLMCFLPKTQDQHWAAVSDAYGVKLWDIYPTCQIAGICDDDTVLVDGAFGATIHWDKFQKVANTRQKKSVMRYAAQCALHGAPYALVVGLLLWRTANDALTFLQGVEKVDDGFLATRATDVVEHWVTALKVAGFLLIAGPWIVFMAAPYLTSMLYRGKFYDTQAWLFGFEGYADLETIESQIFGSRMHRLRWSPSSSPLSRRRKNEFGECEGVNPTTDPAVARKVENAIADTLPDTMRIFTLIDTHTMTVTLFEAVRPPIAVLLCGSEGGMQRAVGCSYDWTNGTCCRETVLRMETTVLAKMSRVSRFKFGVKRKEVDAKLPLPEK